VFADAAEDAWCRSLATHGAEALTSLFLDPTYGGWFSEVHPTGEPVTTTKSCYDHAFVLLAASSARRAGIPGADDLFERAGRVHREEFWSADEHRYVDEKSRDWGTTSPYRGANGNMHSVEASLAAAAAGGGDEWLDRALEIARFFIDGRARANSWRIPEHYDEHWHPDLAYNADKVDDPFRPYGATPGHGLEWSRLLLELEERLADRAPAWLLESARALFDRAVSDGVSDSRGLPYTTDWDGRVVMPARFHWVIAEAVQAADAFWLRTGEQRYRDLRERWWAEIDRWFVVGRTGLWNHELDEDLQVAGRTWPDAPDAYHAYNALTMRTDRRIL
jgi:sulfoquinovose isomerase